MNQKHKFIIVTEDGSIYKTDSIEEGEIGAVEDGYIGVFDCEEMKELGRDGKWYNVTNWKETERK